MEDLVASITAMSTSRMRAIHTRRDPQPVLHDPWGDSLVPASLLVTAVARRNPSTEDPGDASSAEAARIADDFLHASPAFTNVILRARYTEDALRAAIASGVRQYVLLGAGFDSYLLRIPPEAGDLRVIEVDHPATQTLKRQRIAECGLSLAGNVQFVAADLAAQGLDEALAQSTFDPSEPAFFAWLGVTMYLTREANMATLRNIAQCSLAGSQLVFSYMDQKVFDAKTAPQGTQFNDLEQTVRSVGEPFVSGFHPASLAAELRDVGLDLVEDLNELQMAQRFDPAGINGFRPGDRSHVALVRVREASPA
jgi:methyltransferase (TIGR00027 family)